MRVSITCPTRDRYQSVQRFIDSAFGKADDPERIELLFGFDDDDPKTKELLLKNQEEYGNNIVMHEVPITDEIVAAGINIHDRYFNPLARMARGQYVWGTGNDVEFVTLNYDKILEERIEEFLSDKPDRMLYCAVDADRYKTPIPYCPFHVVTCETVEAIGGTTVNEITSWGADQAIWQIFQRAGGGSRIMGLPEVSVLHWSYHTGRKHGEDEVNDGSGWDGDSISYRLSTVVQHLTPGQMNDYVAKLEERMNAN